MATTTRARAAKQSSTRTVSRTPSRNGRKPETVRIEEVTPRRAAAWLESQEVNRELRESRVFQLAGTLTRKEWRLTGDAIVFDDSGHLINGQHRLSAIVRANKAARLLILRNVPTETQLVMDSGLKRSLADALKLQGYHNYFALSAGVNWLYRLSYIEETGNVHYVNPGERPTTAQCLFLLEQNPDLPEYLRRASHVVRAVKTRIGVTTAVWYYCSLCDNGEEDAEAFFDQLTSGLELKKTDPIYHLRRGLIADAHSLGRMPDYRQAAIICKAWNLWREGKPVQNLAWKFGATQKEPFPLPK